MIILRKSKLFSTKLNKKVENSLFNAVTKEKYSPDVLLLNTNIRNGTTLILLD